MGIYQKPSSIYIEGIKNFWIQQCSQKLKKALNDLNEIISQLNQGDYDELYLIRIFDQVCGIFIYNKQELKTKKIIKLQVLKTVILIFNFYKRISLEKNFKELSKNFILNNIYEEYSREELKNLYIFSYLDVNDLVDTLASQDRFSYKHKSCLEETSEVLDLAKDLKIIIPAQKLSLFYTEYKFQFLKQLITPNIQFNHIYQDIDFLIKYLINHYSYKLFGHRFDVITN